MKPFGKELGSALALAAALAASAAHANDQGWINNDLSDGSTVVLLLAGLGIMGFVALRRK